MDDAFQSIAFADDHERCNFLLLHDIESLGGECSTSNGARIRGHALAGGEVEDVFAATFEEASKIAVADDADERVAFGYGGDAKSLARHFVDDLDHRRGGIYTRDGIAGVHELRDTRESLAKFAAGMKVGEVFGAEATALAEHDSQRIAQGEHGGGGSSGSKSERAGFLMNGAVERYVGGLG